MAGTFTNLLYHLVFSTKNREPLIAPERSSRIHEYLGGHIRGEGGVAYEIGGMPDHVHILARLKPVHSISDFMRDLKSHSSGWIHSTFPELGGFAWQDGYGAFTVSHSQIGRVGQYIRNQAMHHDKADFKMEYLRFLKANGIQYDERYIWE
jgi:REP element-mobilizing transposase RayT